MPGLYKNRTPNVCCHLCKIPLYKPPNVLNKTKEFSCSNCKGDSIRERMKNNPERYLAMVRAAKKLKGLTTIAHKYICSICNNKKGYSSKHCQKCAGILRSGDKNPRWKGGITSKIRLERTKFVETIRKQVLKRDNYTCQMCGGKNRYLHVDHIQSWSEYAKLRFSIDNCRTLCIDCHYQITWGKRRPKNSKWGIKKGMSYVPKE